MDEKDPSPKKLLFIVSHSLGEVDIILPLISGIQADYRIQVEILFSVRSIYEVFKKSQFFQYCVRKLDCRVSFVAFPSKFDPPQGWLKRIPFLNSQRHRLLKVQRIPFVLKKLLEVDAVFHESTFQAGTLQSFYLFNQLLKKPFFTYCHGHAFNHDMNIDIRFPLASRVTFLLFDENSRDYHLKQGFNRQSIIGFPRFYREWKQLVEEYIAESPDIPQEHVMVFSRPANPFYMDPKKRELLFENALKIIRKRLPSTAIYIHPHPRESLDELKELIEKIGVSNVHLTQENSAPLLKNSLFGVSFMTSVVLDGLSVEVPIVEYYMEADRFREIYPNGSNYKQSGIQSVDNATDFEAFVDEVLGGRYQEPTVKKQLDTVQELGFMEQVL